MWWPRRPFSTTQKKPSWPDLRRSAGGTGYQPRRPGPPGTRRQDQPSCSGPSRQVAHSGDRGRRGGHRLPHHGGLLPSGRRSARDRSGNRPRSHQRDTGRLGIGGTQRRLGDFEKYPEVATKTAVLLQSVASNHALPDGNKRTALLCAILFTALNGYRWVPPDGDDPDGAETAEMVEATSTRRVALDELASWIEDRLQAI